MSIWKKIEKTIMSLASGEPFSNIFQKFATHPERKIGFTIAVIALSAKMAKADGIVSKEEVNAFSQIFEIPKGQEKHVSNVYNLARQDIAGYEIYAKKIAKMLKNKKILLENIIEGLLFISIADGAYHPKEDKFVNNVASIFSIKRGRLEYLKNMYIDTSANSYYKILNVSPGDNLEQIRKQWKKLVLAHHPDMVLARGLPEEAIRLTTVKLARINEAWENIKAIRETSVS